ncbi:MAG: L-histidine N(alpha)-methyltransferase [Acidobacteria bacterium]|nr:MAG: L-histidine N(alpha)-methyltransferase [Acidobacteriota bacterium]
MAETLTLPALPEESSDNELLQAARAGLLREGQKSLPCKYLYDEVGSLLFEAICALPEYGLTAADERLLRAHAREMIAPFRSGVMVAELGSGSARKTRWILRALTSGRKDDRPPTRYWPIEISSYALERSQRELAAIAGLEVEPLAEEYVQGLRTIARRRRQAPDETTWRRSECRRPSNAGERRSAPARPPGGRLQQEVAVPLSRRPLLVLFLGSTLGNFDPPDAVAFLQDLCNLLQPGDGLLLGLDLVKPAALLRRAYDDPAGVTAAFNKNLLARLNRELGTDFDLAQWQHRAVYRARQRRVEMHLRARRAQRVRLPDGEVFEFARGETIWTESSHKYRLRDIRNLLTEAGFRLERQWVDAAWPFAETLALVN